MKQRQWEKIQERKTERERDNRKTEWEGKYVEKQREKNTKTERQQDRKTYRETQQNLNSYKINGRDFFIMCVPGFIEKGCWKDLINM